MDFQTIGRLLLLLGVGITIIGGVMWLLGRFTGLGGLPGDIRVQTENVSCFVPITSMIILSVLLTIVLNVIIRLLR